MEGWIRIYHSTEEYQAVLIKDRLEREGLHPVIVNQKDREFPMIGETEVYIAPEEQAKAEHFLADVLKEE